MHLVFLTTPANLIVASYMLRQWLLPNLRASEAYKAEDNLAPTRREVPDSSLQPRPGLPAEKLPNDPRRLLQIPLRLDGEVEDGFLADGRRGGAA